MPRRLVMLCALFGLMAARAEALSLPTLPLQSYTTELAPLDPGGVLANVKVYVSDTEPYASFFLEAARVQGTMVLSDSLTSQFRQALDVVAAAAGETVGPDPAEWPGIIERVNGKNTVGQDQMTSLRHGADRLEQMIGPLAAAVEKTPHLIAQVPALANAAPQSFPGLRNKLKLARTVGSLWDTSNQLKSGVGHLKRTLDNLRAIIAAVRH